MGPCHGPMEDWVRLSLSLAALVCVWGNIGRITGVGGRKGKSAKELTLLR